MPELPEVETVMRGLRRRLHGRRIVHVAVHRPDLRRALPPDLARCLTGATVTGFRRRGKYMLMRLDTDISVLLHLGMSGRILVEQLPDRPPGRHEHVVLRTDDAWQVAFVDPRRFGAIDLVPTAREDAHPLLRHLGPEPLDDAFTGAVLARVLAGRRTSIKAALLDQRLVAGLGNIYVSEALFRARIAPACLAGTISRRRVGSLVAAIRATLAEAIAAGGSSLRDYVQPDGELGYFQHAFRVYGRAGLPCERCRHPARCPLIQRMTQSGRSTYWCPKTQTCL